MESLSPHLEEIVREAIIQASLQLVDEGLVLGTAGNISVRMGDSMLITPSSRPYETLKTDDICAVPLDGDDAPVESSIVGGVVPSSETPLHRAAYLASPTTNAVVHFHGRWVSAASQIGTPALPINHYHTARLGPSIPVIPYSHFGSPALAEAAGEAFVEHRGVLMANHGASVTGTTLKQAMYNARMLEWLARLTVDSASFPHRTTLTPEDIAEVSGIYVRRTSESRTK